ncbi:MAG: Zn-ribbon domain-containing OB-fold protein [Haloarculaceae archaeon]
MTEQLDSKADVTADSAFTLPGFFDALADGRLMGADCQNCEQVMVPPRAFCYACGSGNVVADDQPTTGEVVTYTEVRTPPPAFEDEAPYTVAVVELDSGARLTGRVRADYEAVAIGDRVELTTREPTDREKEFSLSYEETWPLHRFELL